MTDAPNFGTKFGRRKPCLRYIGLLRGTTCGAPVGRGDLAQPTPSYSGPPVGGGLRPAPWQRLPHRMVLWAAEIFPHRVGADLCVRPETPPPRTRPRADTSVGPYRIWSKPSSPPENRAGTEPRPYQFDCSLHQPQKTGCLSAKPANQLSILHYQLSIPPSSQFSPASCKLPFPVLY